jgi:YbbR domain-containing protein
VIDLNRANARRQLNFNLDINPAQLNLPFGMVVERVLPRRIPIQLEKKASKILPLKLQFSGQLPGYLSLHHTSLEPQEVEVYGPRTIISKLKEIPIRPIDLENLPGMDQIPVEPQLPDDRLTITGGSDVRFHYQLKASSSNLELKNLPIRFLTANKKIVPLNKVASVKLLVPEKIKNRSNVSSSIQIWAEIPKGARGKTEVTLRVVLPPTVHLLEVIPKTIIVNIQ